jgi:hypothetical protein
MREYLAGLLAPRDRNKTLTALAGAEPVAGAGHPAVQRLQFFLSESRWDPERVNARRLELLLADPATAPHEGGVLVIDDSGDRKDGVKTAHVGHQWLGRYGKTDSGVVTVTTVWADERLYYPVHAVPYTPARHFGKGKNDPAFRTKLAIGADLAVRARGIDPPLGLRPGLQEESVVELQRNDEQQAGDSRAGCRDESIRSGYGGTGAVSRNAIRATAANSCRQCSLAIGSGRWPEAFLRPSLPRLMDCRPRRATPGRGPESRGPRPPRAAIFADVPDVIEATFRRRFCAR